MPETHATLWLASGQEVKVKGVLLYPSSALATVLRLRNEAAEKMGGVSTGIGFIGSPTWVLGAGAALGLVEGLLSGSARKEGARLIIEAQQKAEELRRQGVWFPIIDVTNADQPNPNAWSAMVPAEVTESVPHRITRSVRETFLARYGKTEADVRDGLLTFVEKHAYSHNGDDFVSIDTDSGVASVRWSSVSTYIGPSSSTVGP